MNSTTKTILIIGVIAAVAGVGYYLYQQQKKKEHIALPPVAATGTKSAGSSTADIITAGTSALDKLYQIFG